MDKTLLEIKEAEEEAVKILQNAEKKALKLELNAKEALTNLISAKRNEHEDEKKQKLDTLKKSLQKERARILKQAQLEVQALESKAHKNISMAVDGVVALFKEYSNK